MEEKVAQTLLEEPTTLGAKRIKSLRPLLLHW